MSTWSWIDLTFPGAPNLTFLKSSFERIVARAAESDAVAMFVEPSRCAPVSAYFSPQAASVASTLLTACGARPCAKPADVVLLVGGDRVVETLGVRLKSG